MRSRKLFALLCAAVMVTAGAVPALPRSFMTVQAMSETYTSGNFRYQIEDDNSATIIGYVGTSETVVIPNTLDGHKVKSIESLSLIDENVKVKTVKIMASLETLGRFTFIGLEYLESVNIPSTVRTIPEGCFWGCTNLSKVRLPDGLAEIGMNAFVFCDSLATVDIPDSVKVIGDGAFSDCGLTEVELPKGLISVSSWAFGNCKKLKKVTLPADMTTVPDYLFCDDTALTTVIVPEGVKNLGEGTFKGCTSLRTISLPETLTTIKKEAFKGSGLMALTLPSSLTAIGERAFEDCSGLSVVVGGSGLKKAETFAFKGTPFIDNNKKELLTLGGVLLAANGLTDGVILPDSITYIPYGAIQGQELTGLTIPKNAEVEAYAVMGCRHLTTVYVNSGCTLKGNTAYSSFGSLEKIYVVEDCKRSESFGGDGVTVYEIPALKRGDVNGDGSVTNSDGAAFSGHIKALKLMTGPQALAAADIDSNGKVESKDLAKLTASLKGLSVI